MSRIAQEKTIAESQIGKTMINLNKYCSSTKTVKKICFLKWKLFRSADVGCRTKLALRLRFSKNLCLRILYKNVFWVFKDSNFAPSTVRPLITGSIFGVYFLHFWRMAHNLAYFLRWFRIWYWFLIFDILNWEQIQRILKFIPIAHLKKIQ